MGQVEAALDVLRGAGYPLPDNALPVDALEDPAPELYDDSLRFKDHSVGISRFFPQEETVNDYFPLSPAISQWLDVHSDILQGNGGLGKTQRASPYVKGQHPRFPAISPGRYLPVHVDTLFTCPRAPPLWYQVCNNQGNPVPVALQVSVRETEELIAVASRDLAVISELDWLTSGASHLLGQMAATLALLLFMSSITLLQRYALETCRSMEMLCQSHLADQGWPPV